MHAGSLDQDKVGFCFFAGRQVDIHGAFSGVVFVCDREYRVLVWVDADLISPVGFGRRMASKVMIRVAAPFSLNANAGHRRPVWESDFA